MAVAEKKQPIVVKKIKKGGHGHHGGAWKVAYADFVTAMMAFFLLMWLLGSTNDEQRKSISDWFDNPSAVRGEGGYSTSLIELGGAMEMPRGEGEPMKEAPQQPLALDEMAKLMEDKSRLDELMDQLKEQIEKNPALSEFKDQVLLDITSEGLRIQIVDKEGRPMFDLGGTRLKSYTQEILREIAGIIEQVPNHVSLTGHTDARPYHTQRRDYSNWELSTDRANAARRELIEGGMGSKKIGRVVGLSSSVLFNDQDPYDPINRRISIVVLNRATERAIGLLGDKPDADVETGLPGLIPTSSGIGDGDAGGTPVPEPLSPPLAQPGGEPAPDVAGGEGDLEQMFEQVLGPPGQ